MPEQVASGYQPLGASLELSRYDCSVRYISLDVATGMWEEFWLTGALLAASKSEAMAWFLRVQSLGKRCDVVYS